MELDHDSLAEEAMQEDVDLHRLYVELVETLVGYNEPSIQLPGGLHAAPARHDEMRRQIRKLGYEGLKDRQWISVVNLPESDISTPMEALESLINIYGRHIKISDPKELKLALTTYSTLDNHLPRDPFLHCLGETALNQVLDKRGIGRIEMNRVTDATDESLARQSREMAQLVRNKIGEVLTQS